MDYAVSRQEVEAILREELESLRERVIRNIDSTGKRASGRTQRSLEVTTAIEGDTIVGALMGRSYFGALETGTQPWAKQYTRPPKFFIEIIEEWMRDKGISGSAGGIAYSIMRRGSAQYRQGARTDVYSEEIEKTYDIIQQRVAGLFEAQIINSLLR